MSTTEQRARMARAIVDFEARRDAQGRLAFYALPAGDGGGSYEVAGINDRYHPAEAEHLAQLIRAGQHAEAESYVAAFILRYTDVSSAGCRPPRMRESSSTCATVASTAARAAPPASCSVRWGWTTMARSARSPARRW